MPQYTVIVTFKATNEDAIDSGELEGIELFDVEAPMVAVKAAPDGVEPFLPTFTGTVL